MQTLEVKEGDQIKVKGIVLWLYHRRCPRTMRSSSNKLFKLVNQTTSKFRKMKKVFAIAHYGPHGITSMYNAQKYFTRCWHEVSFLLGKTKMENISDALNSKVAAVLDASTGNIEFTVLIKSFHF
jgi:hypothetical protein